MFRLFTQSSFKLQLFSEGKDKSNSHTVSYSQTSHAYCTQCELDKHFFHDKTAAVDVSCRTLYHSWSRSTHDTPKAWPEENRVEKDNNYLPLSTQGQRAQDRKGTSVYGWDYMSSATCSELLPASHKVRSHWSCHFIGNVISLAMCFHWLSFPWPCVMCFHWSCHFIGHFISLAMCHVLSLAMLFYCICHFIGRHFIRYLNFKKLLLAMSFHRLIYEHFCRK